MQGKAEFDSLRDEVNPRSEKMEKAENFMNQMTEARSSSNKVVPIEDIPMQTLKGDKSLQSSNEVTEMVIESADVSAKQVSETTAVASAGRANAGESLPPVSFGKLVTQKRYRLPLFVAVVCHVAQQWSGINAVFSFSSEIFTAIGLPVEIVQYCTLSTGTSSLISVALSIPLFVRFGRRTLVLLALIVMIFGLTLLTISGVLGDLVEFMNYMSILAVVIFIFGCVLQLFLLERSYKYTSLFDLLSV